MRARSLLSVCRDGGVEGGKLPEDGPEVVALYLNWVYTSPILSCHPTSEKDSNEIRLLVEAFVFGEKIQDGRFRDAVIDAAIKSTLVPDIDGQIWFPGPLDVKRAYDGTPSGSDLYATLLEFSKASFND